MIEEIGGQAPGNDTLVGVLWSAMDPQTRTHVSGKMDTEAIYCELRMAVMKHVVLIGATTSTKSPTAMDIGAIETSGTKAKTKRKTGSTAKEAGKTRRGEEKKLKKE